MAIKHSIARNTFPGTRPLKTKQSDWIYQRTGISGDRIKTDPAWDLFRQYGKEFGQASKAGKLIRQAFYQCCKPFYNSGLNTRLVQQLLKVLKTDIMHATGNRKLSDAQLNLLEGFQFNPNHSLDKKRSMLFELEEDYLNRNLYVQVPSFVPFKLLKPPGKITHFRLFTVCVSINLKKGTFEADGQISDLIPFTTRATPAIQLVNKITGNRECIQIVGAGIEYYVQSQGKVLLYKSGHVNPFAIIKIWRAWEFSGNNLI